jgi:hypothetical protein
MEEMRNKKKGRDNVCQFRRSQEMFPRQHETDPQNRNEKRIEKEQETHFSPLDKSSFAEF